VSRSRTPGTCREQGVLRHNRVLLMAGDLIQIYQCFCDRTRLRILHLLTRSPLCVCHFQEIFGEPQAKVSKHLAYLRKRRMVVAKRDRNWMIYSLPAKRSRELETNLKCLQDCARSDVIFKRDLAKLGDLREACCEPAIFRTKKQALARQ
jgi:ArsR family transcriptional regulator, arsenate/arsenite/antimonite-responsive transcriptional repressor